MNSKDRFSSSTERAIAIWKNVQAKPGKLFLVCAAILSLLLVVNVAFFLYGGLHGLYADDYVYKAGGVDLARAGWNFNPGDINYRVLGITVAVNLASKLPEYEFLARVAIVIVHLLNVGLLGLLAYRLTGSSFAALLSSAYFLTPVSGNEGLVWFSGAIFYTAPMFLLLVGFHLVLSCRTVRNQFGLLIGAILAWTAMILFIEEGFFLILLLPLFVAMARSRGEPISPRAWMPVLGVTYALLGAYVFFVLRTSPVVGVHGQTSLDPIFILSRRVPETFDSLLAHLDDWGLSGIWHEALELGGREWLSVPGGWMLLVGLAASLGLVAFGYPDRPEKRPVVFNAALLFLAGSVWLALALAPVLFIVNLSLSSRVLLFPSAGLALSLAGLSSWVVNLSGRWNWLAIRLALLSAAVVVFANTLTMAGVVRVYQLRSDLDRRQIAMLRSAVPELPARIWLMPLGLNERSVSARVGHSTILDSYLYGLFEVPWATEPALQMEYGRGQIRMVDKDEYGKVHLKGLLSSRSGGVDTLSFEGAAQQQEVPVGQLLAFTFRQGHLILLNPLVISASDSGDKITLNLPLAVGSAPVKIESQSFGLKLESP